jgi:hypothetical protein
MSAVSLLWGYVNEHPKVWRINSDLEPTRLKIDSKGV